MDIGWTRLDRVGRRRRLMNPTNNLPKNLNAERQRVVNSVTFAVVMSGEVKVDWLTPVEGSRENAVVVARLLDKKSENLKLKIEIGDAIACVCTVCHKFCARLQA